jgi:hypothetical protein
MVKILISCTRPRADEIVEDLGHDISIASPALCVQKLNSKQPNGDFDAMLITSRHVVIDELPDLPTICVGSKTSDISRLKGLDVVQTGRGNIQDLDLSSYKDILYPCAKEPTDSPNNCTPWPIYETCANPDFKIDNDVTHVAVFSVKGAYIVRGHDLHDKTLICLSQKIADVFDGVSMKKLVICTHPNYDVMKQLILKDIGAHT